MTDTVNVDTLVETVRSALALHYSMGMSGESASKQSMEALDEGLAALSDLAARARDAEREVADFRQERAPALFDRFARLCGYVEDLAALLREAESASVGAEAEAARLARRVAELEQERDRWKDEALDMAALAKVEGERVAELEAERDGLSEALDEARELERGANEAYAREHEEKERLRGDIAEAREDNRLLVGKAYDDRVAREAAEREREEAREWFDTHWAGEDDYPESMTPTDMLKAIVKWGDEAWQFGYPPFVLGMAVALALYVVAFTW